MELGSGDGGGFDALYDRYFPQVYRFLYARLKNQPAVEAATAEVFFEAFRELDGNFASEPNFSRRLYELATEAIKAHSKSRWSQAPGQPLTLVMPRPRTDTRSSFRNFHGIAIVKWRPRWQFVVELEALSLVLSALGLFLFGATAAITHGNPFPRVTVFQVVLQIALLVGLGVAHELTHALVCVGFGGRPRVAVALWGRIPAASFVWTAGRSFSRSQDLITIAAPAVLITCLGLLAAAGPGGPFVIIPFAANLGGCAIDAISFWRLARGRPRPEDILPR